jgi:plasmid stabilization system protein ParE
MWSLEILPRAEKEIAQAEDWYEARREGLGQRFLDEIEAMFDRIADGPTRFPRWLDDARYRQGRAVSLPYVVMFIEEPATHTVTVAAVAHTSRQPGYWK